MKEIYYAAIFCTIFIVTTTFCVLRWIIDIQRYLNTRSIAGLASLISFIIGWIFYTASFACTLWGVVQTLKIEQGGENVVLYIPALGVGIEQLALAVKITLVFPGYALIASLWSVKASFCLLNFILAGHMSPSILRLLKALGIYLFLSGLASILTVTFWCRPFKSQWEGTSPEFCNASTSRDPVAIYVAMNISSDIFTMLIPALILRTLNLTPRDKFAYAFLFFLGFLTVAATIVRSYFVFALGEKLRGDPLGIDPNISRTTELLASSEAAVALIAASLPSLRSKFHQWRRRKDLSTQGKSFGGTSGASGTGKEREVEMPKFDIRKLVIHREFSYEVERAEEPGMI